MGFRLVFRTGDLQWSECRNSRYFTLFHRIRQLWGQNVCHSGWSYTHTVCNKNVAQRI